MPYSIHQLAALAHVSVRTLHYYDEVGLVCPSRAAKNGYRQYEQADLLKLQQILFFRELDFSIEDIKRMMNAPTFDPRTALRDQRYLLELKRKRLTKLMRTIDLTLQKQEDSMSIQDDELYDAFNDEDTKAYADEAKQRWGNTEAYKQSMARVGKMTKKQMQELKEQSEAFMKELAKQMAHGPKSDIVQRMIDQHYNALRAFYEPTLELYRGLATMYVDDPRFGKYYLDRNVNPTDMRDAMLYYVECQSTKSLT